MNKVRIVVFLIFFAVVGFSISMSMDNLANTPKVLDIPKVSDMPEITNVPKIPEIPQKLQCSNDLGECYTTTLSRVIDGDTIKTKDDKSIRFSLVSAPELNEDGGQESKVFLEILCPVGSKIIIDEDDGQLQGSYGRTIAQIHCNGMSLNAEMIYNNHAIIDTRYCEKSEFAFESWAVSECNFEK